MDKVAFMKAAYLHIAILFFVLIALILAITMLSIVVSKNVVVKRRRSIAAQLEPWIMDVILEPEGTADGKFEVPADITVVLQNKLAHKVLLRELIKVKKSLSGVSGVNIEKLYTQCGLDVISINRLKSKSWHLKAKGIQELAMMSQHQQTGLLSNFTNHPDMMVRMEAQTAMVRLQGYKGLQFFDTLTYPLSEWHQVNLLYLLADQPIFEEHGILNWLHSSNESIAQFALKLIAEQHASEYYDEVVNCLKHPADIVRKEATLCLGQIPSQEAANELSNLYVVETNKNIRLAIIDEFVRTGSSDDLSFLQPLQSEEDVDVKLAANKTVLYLQKKFTSL